jgi:thioesterase domain-containing protein
MCLTRFPLSSRRGEATERLGLLDALLNSQRDAQARQQELEDRIAELTRETRMLRARVDSMAVQGDSVRAALVRAENERRDREAQINALRLELQRLKEIDLKRPAKPIRPI